MRTPMLTSSIRAGLLCCLLAPLFLSSTARAEGLCEQTEESYAPKAWSQKTKQLAVERVSELCEEDEDMNERRQTFQFLAVMGVDGEVAHAFVDGDAKVMAAFRKVFDLDEKQARPRAEAAAWLKANGFEPIKSAVKSPNKKCRVKHKASKARGEEDMSIDASIVMGKKTLWTETLEGRGSKKYSYHVYFLPGANAALRMARTPELHGPTAPDGSFGPDLIEVPHFDFVKDAALAACFAK